MALQVHVQGEIIHLLRSQCYLQNIKILIHKIHQNPLKTCNILEITCLIYRSEPLRREETRREHRQGERKQREEEKRNSVRKLNKKAGEDNKIRRNERKQEKEATEET